MTARESWAHRAATMHPQHSKMEDAIMMALFNKGDVAFMMDQNFPIQETTPDFYFPAKRLAVYLDGEKVHAKRHDKDSRIRELLTKRHGIRVVSITYHGNSQKEQQRILNRILEEVK